MADQPPSVETLDVTALWALAVAFEKRLAAELVPLGLTVSTFRLVGEVMREPEGIRQGELARRLGVKPPSISAAVARLEEGGVVHRIKDPDDPRARRVCLCPDAPLMPGVDVLSRMDDLLFGAMSEDERTQARALIQTLSDGLQS